MSDTKERPIILTADEVKAVLAGDKTQHRVPALTDEQIDAGYKVCYGVAIGQVIFTKDESDDSFDNDGYITANYPFGVIGDQLWVQEEHRPIGWLLDDGEVMIEYKDGCSTSYNYLTEEELETNPNDDYPLAVIDELLVRKVPINEDTERFDFSNPDHLPHWRSADVMPQFASRALLEITDIRIERVQDITHNDSVAEYCFNFGEKKKQCIPPLSGFAEYWMEKHGDDSWCSNPWVWVIEFKQASEANHGHN